MPASVHYLIVVLCLFFVFHKNSSATNEPVEWQAGRIHVENGMMIVRFGATRPQVKK